MRRDYEIYRTRWDQGGVGDIPGALPLRSLMRSWRADISRDCRRPRRSNQWWHPSDRGGANQERQRDNWLAPRVPQSRSRPVQPTSRSQGRRRHQPPAKSRACCRVELRRVGCLTGSTDGSWNTDSRRALKSFNKYSGSQLDAKVASIDALDAVKLKQSRVCTLECERGYRAEGERCVKTACQSGYVQDDDGDCVRVRERAAKHRSIAEPEKPRAEPRPRKRAAAAGGGERATCPAAPAVARRRRLAARRTPA